MDNPILLLTSVNNDVSRRESIEIQETAVQKRRSSIIKTQKNNTPAAQSSEHTAVDINESTTELDDKSLTEPPPAPPVSIFLQTADFLLNVNVLVVSDTELYM